MKKLFLSLMLFLCLASLANVIFAQKTPIQATKSTTPQEQDVLDVNTTAGDRKLLEELQKAKNNLFECYKNYWKNKAVNKVQTLNDCRDLRTNELAEIYSKLSKRPNAIKLMLSKEMSESYSDSSSRIFGADRKSEIETNSESQVELQRIVVIQNQRIIELLEQLLKKKP